MEVSMYSIKVKISKKPDPDGTRYANHFQTGICLAKTAAKAREVVLNKFNKHHQKQKMNDVSTEITKCVKLKNDFVFQQ